MGPLDPVGAGGDALATAYCVQCTAPREMRGPHEITMENGRPATEGRCAACGTRIFKIGAPVNEITTAHELSRDPRGVNSGGPVAQR